MTKKVLVVDDSATVRQQLRVALEPVGFEVVEASDGLEGIRAIRSNAQLSMVICDINMPRMNGLDMLDSLKAEQVRPDLPILMLTSEAQPPLIKRARDAGAKGWIVKPFNANLLVSAVQKLAL